MKKSAYLFLIFLAFSAAANAISVEFTISAEGVNKVTTTEEIVKEVCTFNADTNLTKCVNQTKTVENEVTQPWSSEQDIEVDCELSCNYQIPTFIKPSTATISKYILDYNMGKDYTIAFKTTNKTYTQNSNDKIHIEVKPPEPEKILLLEKISSQNLTVGINQVNIVIRNLYSDDLSFVSADITGSGIKTTNAVKIQSLAPGEKDYVFLTVNATEPGIRDAAIKLTAETLTRKIDVNYASKFYVISKETPAQELNTSALESQLSQLRSQLKTYETDYLGKKAQGYIVSEIYDSIKEARNNLQNAQLALTDNKLKDVQKYIMLAQSNLDYIKTGLETTTKTKKTFTDKLKENAVLITTISAAIIAIIGLLERTKMKKERLKEKLMMKKQHMKEQPKKPVKKGKLPKINLKKLKELEPETPPEES